MTITGSKLIEDSSEALQIIMLKIYDQAFKDAGILIKDTLIGNFNNIENINDIIVKIDEVLDNVDNSKNSLIANSINWDDLNQFRQNIANQKDPFEE